MQQFYFTSCPEGKRVDGFRGFGIRAMSPGLSKERCLAVVRYAGYEFTPARSSGNTAAGAPVRLAFLKTPEGGRLLIHAVDAGLDQEGRPGNYFAHVLVDLPVECDTRAAIRSWQADFWRRHDTGGGLELSEPDGIPSGSVLTAQGLHTFLADERYRELFTFVLSCQLQPEFRGKVYLVAEPETVAWCVFGLTRVLPPVLLADFSFSTYEKAPVGSGAQLTGTWSDGGSGEDLAAVCYRAPNAAFNLATRRCSESGLPLPCAASVVQALLDGRDQEGCSLLDADLLDRLIVHRFLQNPRLDAPLIQRVAQGIRNQPSAEDQGALLTQAIDALAPLFLDPAAGVALAALLDEIIRIFGSVHRKGSIGVYCHLLDRLRSQPAFWQRRRLAAFLAVSLGVVRPLAMADSKPWTDLAQELTAAIWDHGGADLFTQVIRCTDAWPDPTFASWQELIRQTKPPSRSWFGRVVGR